VKKLILIGAGLVLAPIVDDKGQVSVKVVQSETGVSGTTAR
jgi:hypothetical protein